MMNIKRIKYIFLPLFAGLLLISATIIMSSNEGLKKIEKKLNDGEILYLSAIIDPIKGDDLFNKKPLPNMNSAVLRSFDNDTNNVNDLVNYANLVSESRNLGYWSVIPYAYYGETFSTTRITDYTYTFRDETGYDWKKVAGFNNYYHSLFRNKVARTILADQTIEFLCTLTKAYPSDFKKSLNRELSALLTYTNTLKANSPLTNTDKLGDYWKGFILRRVRVDNIPVTEIQSTIIKAQAKIDSVDVKTQADAMYEISVNNQISILYSIDKFKLISKSSPVELQFGYDASIQTIFYNKDKTGDFYMLNGYQNNKPFKWLFTKNLERIN
jgi:hypothetical protein